MSPYHSIRLDDLRERQQCQNQHLTANELALLARLEAEERRDWENESPPHWLGGDYPDVF